MKKSEPAEGRGTSSKLAGVVVVVYGLVCLLPLLWMIASSFKTSIDINDPSKALVFTPTLENYVKVLAQENFLFFMFNSAVVALVSTGLALLVGVPAAYAIARFKMRHTSSLILFSRVVPHITLLVPWYYIFAKLGLVGTYPSLILSHMFIAVPLVVWIMIGIFEVIPVELEEAAQVDGLTPIRAFLKVILPLGMPGIATASVLSLIFSWNNFVFALVLSGMETRTLPVAIFNFVGYASIDWGALMAACVTITLPMLVLAMVGNRYVVAGLTAGAVKG
ncbi:sugar ABC transporter permease [Tessaracoccus aquimaris]|uniref:Sugar ABC transporter permease n=1 Tax=Tessaracoccus aquimaris TaxID=1332264 RepID=A0A1Q2CKY8_9ACTN|nr:carbohydrate ABC transporter permease [Tessaracoccus aquimaris]AQP46769.1 sugar ABC transporter permease [Tessaracoccus aquimaris]